MSCDAIDGQCNCKENINGPVCTGLQDGYYYKTLDDILYEAEETNSVRCIDELIIILLP